MKVIQLKSKPVDKEIIGTTVYEKDMGLVVDEPCIISVDGKPSIIYGPISLNKVLLNWAMEYKFGTVERMAYRQGKKWDLNKTREEYFGFTATRPVFNITAGATRTTKAYPKVYKEGVIKVAKELEEAFKAWLPDQYSWQKEDSSMIKPYWRMDQGIYTQCVVNNANAFNYHKDANNSKNHWNSMAVYSWGVVGGHTVIPSIDTKFIMNGNNFLIFDAQNTVHGVTPITKKVHEAFRFSVVFYAHELMKKMGTPEEEFKKSRASLEKRLDPEYQEKRKKQIISRRRDRYNSIYK